MIALLGYGKTNQALLRFLNANKRSCLVFDDIFCEERVDEQGNRFLPSSKKELNDSELAIPSPGISPSHSLIQNSSNLVSEYDFLLNKNQLQIWISGTNGKTTTTEMLQALLCDYGGKSGGNIGLPLAEMQERNPQIWILETSSFSLHYTKKVFPKVYLLLPLSEDHISWHGSFENYIQDKLSPLARMNEDCTAIIPHALSQRLEVKESKAQIVLYQESVDLVSYFDFDLSKIKFNEPFLLDALLALSGAKILLGKDLSEKLLDFQIGKHKLEVLRDEFGRTWVDDSKGTNVDATIWAVRAYGNSKIYLILGGDDKGADLSLLFEELRHYRLEIFGIGSNTLKLQELSKVFDIKFHSCFELEKAVNLIDQQHDLQSIALLSPAAASLDQFSSYKERGERFQKFVQSLSAKR